MKLLWHVDQEDVQRVQAFVAQHRDNAFVLAADTAPQAAEG